MLLESPIVTFFDVRFCSHSILWTRWRVSENWLLFLLLDFISWLVGFVAELAMLVEMLRLRDERGAAPESQLPEQARRQHMQACAHSHQPITLTKDAVMVRELVIVLVLRLNTRMICSTENGDDGPDRGPMQLQARHTGIRADWRTNNDPG